MAIDGLHGTAMAIDELRWDLSTGCFQKLQTEILLIIFEIYSEVPFQ